MIYVAWRPNSDAYLISIGIIGFAVMAGALMLLTRRITNPLRLLTAGAEKIGMGDLDTRILINAQDEFGRLAHVFNQMSAQLQETLTALQPFDLLSLSEKVRSILDASTTGQP